MSKTKTTTSQRVCDQCGKEVSTDNELIFGGITFKGWYSLQVESPATYYLAELQTLESLDFCSKECLVKYVNSDKLDSIELKNTTKGEDI